MRCIGSLVKTSVLFASLILGCQQEPLPRSEGHDGGGCGPSNEEEGYALADGDQVTFYADILPILDSKTNKCTVCHPGYFKPSSLENGDEIDRVLTQVRSGEMPPEEDKQLRPEEVELLEQWKEAGLERGSEADAEAENDSSVARGGDRRGDSENASRTGEGSRPAEGDDRTRCQ